jgi:hypothetical protein
MTTGGGVMGTFPRFVAAWGAGILVFDAAASVTSLLTGLPYVWFTVGSVAIYLGAGYNGAPRFGLKMAVLATIFVALIDATLGWGLSWLIGPGQVQGPDVPTAALVLSGAIGALIIGGVSGLIGGWAGLKRRPQPVREP